MPSRPERSWSLSTVRAAASRRHLHHRLGSRSWLVNVLGKIIALAHGQQCRTAPGVFVCLMVSCADVPASAFGGGSWALSWSLSCVHTCSWPAVLPGCVMCSCSRCACLCAHLWGGKRSFAREEPICVCHMQTLHRVLSGHTKKRHCSGAFRSHDMISGLSEALWTLAT